MKRHEGHTPGPWHYDAIDDESQWVMDAAGNYLLQVITHDDEGHAVPADIGERNARLAADAPALLAQLDALADAARELLACLDDPKHPRLPLGTGLAVNDLREALAEVGKS